MFKIGDRVFNRHHGLPQAVGTIVEIRFAYGMQAVVKFDVGIRVLYPVDHLSLYFNGLERAQDKIKKR